MASGKRRILAVDDDPEIRDALRVVLEGGGYVVKTAANGTKAMKVLEDWKPDLIILDIMMDTDTEGFEVAQKIRRNPVLADTPIIMLTSFIEKVRQEGPEQFLDILGEEWPAQWLFEKPVDVKKLVGKIKGLLSGA